MEALFGAGDARAESPTFDDMVAPWLGQKAMRPVTGADYATYQPYLDEIDTLEILAQYYPDGRYRDSAGLRVTDLGTIIDVNLIETYAGPDGRERTRFLEVGGGYGRLAEAVLGIWPHRVCYVMVDAVPASIYFSYAYLSACFPDRRIGWYYGGDAFEPDAFDCYVVPTWHFDRVNADTRYDVCVNVASLQEMEDRQVVHYLALFDRMTRVGGTIHLSNSRDFIEPRRYDYPSNWELLYKRNTPRSWTPYYPVEVFRRTDEDCTAGNGVLEARYLEDLRIAYQGEGRRSGGPACADARGQPAPALAARRREGSPPLAEGASRARERRGRAAPVTGRAGPCAFHLGSPTIARATSSVMGD